MREISYKIEASQAGRTVEQFLKRLHGYSSRTIIKLKHYDEGLLLNGKHVRTIDPLSDGDVLSITFLDTEEHGVERFIRSNRKVEILYEDSDLLVFNKPPSMPCHQSCGHAADTLANVFATHCDKLGMDLMYRPLNRLDRDTSGAVVVAKNRHAAVVTASLKKIYQAVLDGVPPQTEGQVNLPIRREGPDERRRTVAEDGQRSVTNYNVLAECGGSSLVDFYLETGRTHQIRVHMAHLGCPILGDSEYGKASEIMPRQALHCRAVEFVQPVTGEFVQLEAPLPQDMLDACRRLGLFL